MLSDDKIQFYSDDRNFFHVILAHAILLSHLYVPAWHVDDILDIGVALKCARY